MTFNELYPEATLKPDIFGPNPDIWVTDILVQTGRLTKCFVCKALTTWREVCYDHEVAVCSEKCSGEVKNQRMPANGEAL